MWMAKVVEIAADACGDVTEDGRRGERGSGKVRSRLVRGCPDCSLSRPTGCPLSTLQDGCRGNSSLYSDRHSAMNQCILFEKGGCLLAVDSDCLLDASSFNPGEGRERRVQIVLYRRQRGY